MERHEIIAKYSSHLIQEMEDISKRSNLYFSPEAVDSLRERLLGGDPFACSLPESDSGFSTDIDPPKKYLVQSKSVRDVKDVASRNAREFADYICRYRKAKPSGFDDLEIIGKSEIDVLFRQRNFFSVKRSVLKRLIVEFRFGCFVR